MINSLGLHIIEYPSGRFGFVGDVPVVLAYIDPTPELLRAAKFGAAFGPKSRSFETRQEAVDAARAGGFELQGESK